MQREVSVAVLDVGSGKIAGFVASQLEGDDFNIVAQAEVKCSTFYEGRWIDEVGVVQGITTVVRQLAEKTNSKLQKVYVGVPGEFAAVVTKEAEVNYPTPKKITSENVGELFDHVDNFSNVKGFSAISRSPIYYQLDDQRKVFDPIGEVASKLNGLISFIFVDDVFQKVVIHALAECGVNEYDFVAQNLAQAMYLIQPNVRDSYAILIDCGFVTTNVSVVLGDGILHSKCFSVGGGNMSDDLSQVLEIDYEVAEKLLSKLHLNLEFGENEVCKIDENQINVSLANSVVKCRVEEMAESILACLDTCPHKLPNNLPIFVTGGTFAYLKGGYSVLAKSMGKPVYPVQINSPQYDKQEYTSAYGLISIALSQSKPAKVGFFKKLLASLGG